MSDEPPILTFDDGPPPHARDGTCLHFPGLLGPGAEPVTTCRAGVVFRNLAGSGPGWIERLPCTTAITRRPADGPPVECECMLLPTPEQARVSKAWGKAQTAIAMEAVAAVAAASRAKGAGLEGTVTCPRCRGTLRWGKARSNGHLRAKCQTPGCGIAFMQ